MATQAELAYRLTKVAKLRAAIGDGRWHYGSELAKVVGWRFGAPLEEVRNGWDGRPAWKVVKERCNEQGSVWKYRYVGLEPNPRPRPGLTWKGRALKAEARLRELGEAA